MGKKIAKNIKFEEALEELEEQVRLLDRHFTRFIRS